MLRKELDYIGMTTMSIHIEYALREVAKNE